MTKVLKRPLSILLSLVLVLGLIPGMSLTAYAASHSITINNAQHGTVTATVNGSAASSAEEGATVTLTANPDEGYRLKSISGTYKNYYSESFGTGGGTKTHFKVTSTCQTNYRGWRLYNNGTVTVTSTGTQKITKVVFTGCVRGNSAGAAQLGVSSGNLSISGNTIIINNLSNVTSFTLTGKGTNAATQWQSSGVTVYGNSVVDTQLPITKTSDSNVCTFTMPAVATDNVLITAEFEEVPKYTVTWKNWNGDVLETDTVAADATPSYDGATPVRPQDANNTYTFAAWDDGTTTYVLGVDDLPPVTGDVTYTATFTAVPKVINYDGEHTLNPNDRITVSDEDEGKKKFDLKLNQYLNMQMLGIQKKSAIATQGGDDGIRFVTAVNSNLLKGNKIKDYGYIVVKAKEGTPVADIYSKMDNLTYDKVANSSKNIFSCYGSDNTISGDFGKFSTNTDYKYVTLSLTNTSGSTDTVAARFYVKTKDNKFYYADYIDGNGVTHGGMAFTLPIESNSLV